MKPLNLAIGVVLFLVVIALTLVSEGLLLPLLLPVGAYALHLAGVKIE